MAIILFGSEEIEKRTTTGRETYTSFALRSRFFSEKIGFDISYKLSPDEKK